MNGPERQHHRQILFNDLLRITCAPAVAGDPNRPLLASMLAGRRVGLGCLPHHLGLGEDRCRRLLDEYFPGLPLLPAAVVGERVPEWDDLRKLLVDHRGHAHHAELWLADIVTTACGGRDHLWQDLGLADRGELSHLMAINFPALAQANSGDMKWKKFLYRQLCALEGIYVCPAPSCGECADYAKCFSPEI